MTTLTSDKNVYVFVYSDVAFVNRSQTMGTTVRIHDDTHEALRDLKRQTGQAMPDLVARAVDQFYRSLLIAETNRGYAALREEAEAWSEEQEELEVLSGSLADGLDDD